ncbi:MAG TPA: MobF family relaxase [Solirubrobacterales bacterium]|nr:MobF family relaxase [Solirubrobacterales bacterium]
MTKIGRRNANYWIEAVAEGGEDYYTKPGEAPGEWMGELAVELGLDGEVYRDAYTAILAGKHPLTGEVLVRRPEPRVFTDASGRERHLEPILGYDVRFAAPKSVSLLYAVGSPEVRAAILRAHDGAVAEGVSYLERHACFVQRGAGGKTIEPGSGLVAMAFRHRSSRAGDPALHTHLVTANLTRAATDGHWLSLAAPKGRTPFWRQAKAAGYVYQAALRANVTRELGLQWQPVHNGYADLASIERSAIEHFSQRRAEIVEAMAERGVSSAAAAEVAAYRTRDAKDYGVDPDTQRSEWIARAAEFDLTPDSIDGLLRSAIRREPRPIGPAELEGALAELETTHSHFDRRDLICALANQLPEGADAAALDRSVDALLVSERVIEIHRGADVIDSTYYTTPRLWELEQRFVKTASEGKKAGAAVVDEATLAAVLARHSYLSAEQAEMVRRLTTGGERIVPVAALPGSGKTTALAAAREAWVVAGHPVIGVATARSASGELNDAGVPATSITALLIRTTEATEAGHRPLAPGTAIVMDESSTTSTPHAAALAELAVHCEGKLVAIGDPRQIGAVGPGGLYGHLTKMIEPALLTEIRRQRDPLDRRIVELAHEGRGSDALDLLRSRERLVIADTLPEALDALVLDWHERYAAGEDAVMIARRSRDVAELNAKAREVLAAERGVGEGTVTVAGRDFAPGDRVLTRINTPEVSNRERWEVIAVDHGRHSVDLRRVGGDERRVILDPDYLQRRTPSGEPAIQHAYALTTYATESKTFESAFALLDAGISREDFLVAVSRARGATTAYGVAASELTDPELGPGTREIEDSAHELRAGAERSAGEFAAVEVAERKRLEAQPAFELIKRRTELERRLADQDEPTLLRQRLDAVERRLAAGNARLAELAAKREALSAERRPDRGELARIESTQRLSARQLGWLEDERDGLAVEVAIESRRPAGLTADERSELALIGERLEQLRRREVAAERLQPSKLIEEALGARPADPIRAELWNEGVDLIYAFRHRHGVASRGADPLGPKTGDAERRAAELQLARIQRGLGQERPRSAERSISIER